MAIKDAFKVNRKTFFNPRAWADWDGFTYRNKVLFDLLKSIFEKPKPAREETFEQAMQRQGVTESDLEQMKRRYRIFEVIFLLAGLAVFSYAFYLLFKFTSFTGFLISLAASAAFFSQAYQYDFWIMELKQRRLGLTFEDWKKHILGE